MKMVAPSAELLAVTPQALLLVERAGRACYKSEGKMDCECGRCARCVTRASAFVSRLISRGHESVLEHAAATVHVVTDRGISHEIVRHRLCAYSQESTRYCDYGEMAVVPPLLSSEKAFVEWKAAMEKAEETYRQMRERGVQPQWARSVLPTCLKTEVVITANFRQWRHMIRLRAENSRAHPQIRSLFSSILALLRESDEGRNAVFFSDISVEP